MNRTISPVWLGLLSEQARKELERRDEHAPQVAYLDSMPINEWLRLPERVRNELTEQRSGYRPTDRL